MCKTSSLGSCWLRRQRRRRGGRRVSKKKGGARRLLVRQRRRGVGLLQSRVLTSARASSKWSGWMAGTGGERRGCMTGGVEEQEEFSLAGGGAADHRAARPPHPVPAARRVQNRFLHNVANQTLASLHIVKSLLFIAAQPTLAELHFQLAFPYSELVHLGPRVYYHSGIGPEPDPGARVDSSER